MGLKLFAFNFWIKFFSIFFISFLKGRMIGCLDESEGIFCKNEVLKQLAILFGTELTIGQTMEVLVPAIKLKIKNRQNEALERASGGASHV